MRQFVDARYHTAPMNPCKTMISRWLVVLGCAVAGLLAGCTSPQSLNRFSSDKGFQLTENLPYDREHGLGLDVYYPPQGAARPVVVFFYGGRWQSGDKAEYRFVGQALASRGFVAVIPNVRKYPQVRFPEFVYDGARALRWARDNAQNYGGDADKLFVMGHSSGAHIAAMLALNEEYLKKLGGSRSWLRGMIGLAGAYDFMPITAPDLRDLFGPVDRFQYSQPIYYVDGNNPPLLLIHGRDDEVLWVTNTTKLARAVAKAGGAVETVIYDKLSHEMIIASLASFLRGRADVLDNIEEFVLRISSQPRSVRPETEIRGTPLIAEPLQTAPAEELPPPERIEDDPAPEPLQLEPRPMELPPQPVP